MKLNMRSLFILGWLTTSLKILSSDPNIIAQAHHLTADDLSTFNLVATCRYSGENCNNPIVLQQIQAVTQFNFNVHGAPALQKAVFDLLKPIINAYNQAISTIKHSALTQIEQTVLIDFARCLFFKLNCQEIKSDLMLSQTSSTFKILRHTLSFKTDLELAYKAAAESGLVIGLPPANDLEDYKNQSFLELSQKFALNSTDQNLLLRFIRLIHEHNNDPAAQDIYEKVMALVSKLSHIKNCLFEPTCFKQATGIDFISLEDSKLQYEYNVKLAIQEIPSITNAAYEYWQIYSKQQDLNLDLKSIDVSDLEKRLAALKADLPGQDIANLEKRLQNIKSKVITPSSSIVTTTTSALPVVPITIPSSVIAAPSIAPTPNLDNLVELEQTLSHAGHTYRELIQTNLLNKKDLLSSTTYLDHHLEHALIDQNNLAELEKLLINLGYTYLELVNSNLITKQAWLTQPKRSLTSF